LLTTATPRPPAMRDVLDEVGVLQQAAVGFFQAEDGIRAFHVTGVQTCALPISPVATSVADQMMRANRCFFDIRNIPFSLANRRRSEEHTSELQSRENLVCRLLLEKKKP